MFERHARWLKDEKASRVFVLTGKYGTGKSTWSAELCRRGGIAASHLCQWQYDFSAADIVLSLVYQLAEAYEPYQAWLLGQGHPSP